MHLSPGYSVLNVLPSVSTDSEISTPNHAVSQAVSSTISYQQGEPEKQDILDFE
jgi:hypothetical protein